ncbi:hypothetical protein AVEN_167129-1 [Araneus ventricosus]|uniref:Tc3 transposase DNA binding domain-containing protein n=1 Tax=Araneus ventricosus TaxID=182803 RepID=A0A4Y2G9G8_ARAVE|nr:hypothetical protein AVEN_167129-1 [Araneus ventricosus]
MCKTVQRSRGKDVSDFERGQIIGLHQSKKTIKEIAEITGIGLRSVQRIIKTRKDSGEPSTSRNKCGRKNSGSKISEGTGEEKSQKNQLLNSWQCLTRGIEAYQQVQCNRNLKEVKD